MNRQIEDGQSEKESSSHFTELLNRMRSVTLALLSVSAYPWQSWIPAGAGDLRGPCPGLNTLANHNYINHNDQLVSAVYNLDSNLANSLASGAIADVGTASANGVQVLNLTALNAHNDLEHDASISRYDFGDVGADNHTPQRALIDTFKALSADGQYLDSGLVCCR